MVYEEGPKLNYYQLVWLLNSVLQYSPFITHGFSNNIAIWWLPNLFAMEFWGLNGRVLDSRRLAAGFEPHRHRCVVSLSKNINPSLVLVQPRKTRPFKTESLLMGRKESNQTNKPSNFTK